MHITEAHAKYFADCYLSRLLMKLNYLFHVAEKTQAQLQPQTFRHMILFNAFPILQAFKFILSNFQTFDEKKIQL